MVSIIDTIYVFDTILDIYMDLYDIGILCFVKNGAPLYACIMQNCRLLIMEMRL